MKYRCVKQKKTLAKPKPSRGQYQKCEPCILQEISQRMDADTKGLYNSKAVIQATENRPIPDTVEKAAPASVREACALL